MEKYTNNSISVLHLSMPIDYGGKKNSNPHPHTKRELPLATLGYRWPWGVVDGSWLGPVKIKTDGRGGKEKKKEWKEIYKNLALFMKRGHFGYFRRREEIGWK